MSYKALATDYDGTIAVTGQVNTTTYLALKRWQQAGRLLILVTGRRLDNLYEVFPQAKSFDCIVAENGALLSYPSRDQTILLGECPPKSLIETLRKRNVEPLKIGQGIVSTRIPHDITAIEVIQELGLTWRISYNKGAVMLLPEEVDKDRGLRTALEQMNLSPDEVVGVGDGENDIPLLNLCGLSVSVKNALPMLQEVSDWVMTKSYGDGVIELIEKLL